MHTQNLLCGELEMNDDKLPQYSRYPGTVMYSRILQEFIKPTLYRKGISFGKGSEMEPICSRKRSGDCVDEVQLSPKRFRECSSPSTRLSIPLLEWSPEQVGAILLENNVSAEITKLFKGKIPQDIL